MEKLTHIAIVPSPGYSHLISILEFAKHLVHLHPDFHVTCFIPSVGSPPDASKAILETLPSNIGSIFLPPINKEYIPQGAYVTVQIQRTLALSLPSLREVLKSINSRAPLAALVVDFLADEALDLAKELNISSYLYFPSSAMTLSFYLCLPKLDETISGEYRDLTELIQILGCVPVHALDLADSAQDRSGQAYKQFLQRCRRFFSVDGFLVNSFIEIEAGPIRELTEGRHGNPPVYLVGPITQTGLGNNDNGSDCLKWLDKQQPNSVVYVSFGSGGTLSQDQINELALGLELSGQKFLWVLRAPSTSTSAAYLGGAKEDPLQFLPCEFLERTMEQGLVVPSWAPQNEILKHKSISVFLSHCGWNSVLESVLQGVPLTAWPLFAEQRMNAVLLTDGLKVALRPKPNKKGMVEKKEICKLIKSVMEGEEAKEICKRMKYLKDAAVNALRENGSSTKTLSQIALQWKGFSGMDMNMIVNSSPHVRGRKHGVNTVVEAPKIFKSIKF